MGEREINHKKLLMIENKLRVDGERWVGGWDRLVMGRKEGTYCMVHWVLYTTNGASNFISEFGDVPYGE